MKICYALKNGEIKSADLCSPQFIGVLTDDKNTLWKVEHECIEISDCLNSIFNKRIVQCKMCDADYVNKNGVKIWI